MPGQKLPPETVTRLLEEGKGPTEIQSYLREHMGIEVTRAAISVFRKRYTDIPPAKSNPRRILPWKIRREHEGSILRHAILAWHQREAGHALSDERWRNLMVTEARLKESGKVIDYSPNLGFIEVPARPGVDLGVVREPDGVPRPATRGPYAEGERVEA